MNKIHIEYLNELDKVLDDILLFIDNCKKLEIRISIITQIILIYDSKEHKKIRIKIHNANDYDKRFITVSISTINKIYKIDNSLCVSFLELLFKKLNILKDYIKLEP